MNTSTAKIPSSAFLAAGVGALGALSLLLVRSNFGPPSHEIIPIGGVFAIALALGLSGATALRSATDLGPIWRVSRFWGVLLGVSIMAGQLVSALAISFLMEDGPLPHPGHIPGVNRVFVRFFVAGIVALFMTAGFRGAWRTRQVRLGILSAVATGLIGGLISLFISLLVPLLGRGNIEGGSLPLAMIVVAPMLSTVPGTIGAMLGRGFGDLWGPRTETALAR